MISDDPQRADSEEDREVSKLERVLPELVRRFVEAGLVRLVEGPENVRQILSDLRRAPEENQREPSTSTAEPPREGRQPAAPEPQSERTAPREMLSAVLGQFDETKNVVYRAVAKEVRDFLGHTSLPDQLTRALTKLSFEIKTEIRFIPNEKQPHAPKPDVSSSVRIKTGRSAPPPSESPASAVPDAENEP